MQWLFPNESEVLILGASGAIAVYEYLASFSKRQIHEQQSNRSDARHIYLFPHVSSYQGRMAQHQEQDSI